MVEPGTGCHFRGQGGTTMFDFTSAQIHLALNHLPVFAALLATATLLFAAVTRSTSTRNTGLGVLVFAALAALPVYFTGEGAEEIVEHRPGVTEAIIERHEEAAERALATILVAGAVAAAALMAVRLRKERVARGFFVAALIGALASAGLMGQVAHLGGQIRHDELRAPAGVGGGPAAAHSAR